MDKKGLLFYKEYELFYKMAETSGCFAEFCRRAFGRDFSQDGFSDVSQVDLVFNHAALNENARILDIGCGNGKMAKYLQSKTGAFVCGFDFSENAIRCANSPRLPKTEFITGLMGEVNYPAASFDLITSMDTMYFAPDIKRFAAQLFGWLKEGGVFFCGYQEGDVMPFTGSADTTALARALQSLGIAYTATDYTAETYEMLKRKREAALSLKKEFRRERACLWYRMLLGQTAGASLPFEEYKKSSARYIYVVKKPRSSAAAPFARFPPV